MPKIRNMTQPADIAGALASMVDLADRLRVYVRDPVTVAEIDRRIAGSAELLLGCTFLERRHLNENVSLILREVDATGRPASRRASI